MREPVLPPSVACTGEAARGLYVVVAGPDGSGKSTVVEGLIEGVLSGQVQLLHHRPRVLGTRTAHVGVVTEPHAAAPYPRALSTSKLLFVYLDHLLGWWLKIRPWLRNGGDVVMERGWWDLAVDPLRYRLRPSPALVRALGRMLPSPDLTLLLVGDADVVAARKEELTPAETARQLSAWRALPTAATRAVEIDVSMPIDQVHAVVRDAIVRSKDPQRWVVLPRASAPRWYLPSGPARTAVSGLAIYHPVNNRGRVGWEATRLFAAVGGFRVLAHRGSKPPDEVLQLLAPHLPPGVCVAVAGGSHRGRYTALILDERTGVAIAFAKIVRDPDGPAALGAEAVASERFAPLLPTGLRAPRLLERSENVLLFEAMAGVPRPDPWSLPPEVAFLLGRFHAAGATGDGLGPAHGDCAPWNLLRSREGWILVDWAEARSDAPPFEDVFHFLVQAHTLLGRPTRGKLVTALTGEGRPGSVMLAYAKGAGLSIENVPALAESYLERSAARLDVDRRDGRDGLRVREALLRDLRKPARG
jgi:thymidylate kinase